MTIPTKDLHRALAQQQEPECTHPTHAIRDLPDRSYCRKCGKDVPPLMRDSAKSVFPVFPSSNPALSHYSYRKITGVDWGSHEGPVAVEFEIEVGEDGEPQMTNFRKHPILG